MRSWQHRQALAAKKRLPQRPFDFGWSEADPVPFLQHLVGRDRLAIDADQIVLGTAVGHMFRKEFCDSGSFDDLDIIGKTASIIIHIEN